MFMEDAKEIKEPELTEVPDETPIAPSAEPSSRQLAELEVFLKHFEDIKFELSDIRDRFGDAGEIPIDPLKEMREELSEIKNGFAEMKSFMEEFKSKVIHNNANQPTGNQSGYYQVPAMSSMPTPVMPFYQTPNFQPIIPAMPNFNMR
jgi:hypothetical protein